MTSQRPHLLMPSHWKLEFQLIYWRDTNIQSKAFISKYANYVLIKLKYYIGNYIHKRKEVHCALGGEQANPSSAVYKAGEVNKT